jgi:hypothetical protein
MNVGGGGGVGETGRNGMGMKKSFSFEKLMATYELYRPCTRKRGINGQ